MPRLKLVTDDIEPDPPAPLPIANWRRPGSEGSTDTIAEVERAFARVDRAMSTLSDLVEEMDPIPFPRRGDDDDGPWAA